jgi:hypothetical protein
MTPPLVPPYDIEAYIQLVPRRADAVFPAPAACSLIWHALAHGLCGADPGA